MLPLRAPPRRRPARAIQKFEEKPTTSKERRVPAQPRSRTGFRPILSDRPPQYMPVRASAREKAEMRMPAKKAALLSSPIWKWRTSFQA